MISIISTALFFLGLTVVALGSLGIARFPDIYSRLQASSAADTVGVVITLLALILYNGLTSTDIIIGLLMLFIFLTGPIITHSIARAAFLTRRLPYTDKPESED